MTSSKPFARCRDACQDEQFSLSSVIRFNRWRADRPQKGRYREFISDDVVGSDSLLNEVELRYCRYRITRLVGIRVCIKINNRKILSGIAEIIGEPTR